MVWSIEHLYASTSLSQDMKKNPLGKGQKIHSCVYPIFTAMAASCIIVQPCFAVREKADTVPDGTTPLDDSSRMSTAYHSLQTHSA